MAEQQKREFIESLKRLMLFYNNLKTYKPDDTSKVDFKDINLKQQYKFYENPNQNARELENKKSLQLDKAVLDFIMKPENQIEDEQWIKDGMAVVANDMNTNIKND